MRSLGSSEIKQAFFEGELSPGFSFPSNVRTLPLFESLIWLSDQPVDAEFRQEGTSFIVSRRGSQWSGGQ
jgi:hypothetical protein